MDKQTRRTQDGGNTKLHPLKEKKSIRSRKWCLTLNNYTEHDIQSLSSYWDKYIIGKEKGKEGTPHLQCYFEKTNAVAFSVLKKLFPRGHWEKSKGNRKANIKYCSKEKDFIENFKVDINDEVQEIMDDEYKDVVWRPWQQDLLDLLKTKPDRRKIHWYYDKKGHAGKSYLGKYIGATHGCIMGTGKQNDVFNQIKIANESHKERLKIIIIDCPRDKINFMNYGMIEVIKNGFIYSGKFDGGQVMYKIPHVIVFANQEPDKGAWSEDRYDIRYM